MKKKYKKASIRITAIVLAFTMCITSGILPTGNAEAKKKKNLKLAKKKATLTIDSDEKKGESVRIKVKNKPKHAKIKYKSDNKHIAVVNSKGKVTAAGVGTTYIKVKTNNKRYRRTFFKVTVRKNSDGGSSNKKKKTNNATEAALSIYERQDALFKDYCDELKTRKENSPQFALNNGYIKEFNVFEIKKKKVDWVKQNVTFTVLDHTSEMYHQVMVNELGFSDKLETESIQYTQVGSSTVVNVILNVYPGVEMHSINLICDKDTSIEKGIIRTFSKKTPSYALPYYTSNDDISFCPAFTEYKDEYNYDKTGGMCSYFESINLEKTIFTYIEEVLITQNDFKELTQDELKRASSEERADYIASYYHYIIMPYIISIDTYDDNSVKWNFTNTDYLRNTYHFDPSMSDVADLVHLNFDYDYNFMEIIGGKATDCAGGASLIYDLFAKKFGIKQIASETKEENGEYIVNEEYKEYSVNDYYDPLTNSEKMQLLKNGELVTEEGMYIWFMPATISGEKSDSLGHRMLLLSYYSDSLGTWDYWCFNLQGVKDDAESLLSNRIHLDGLKDWVQQQTKSNSSQD